MAGKGAAFWIFEKGIEKLKQDGRGDYSATLKRMHQALTEAEETWPSF